MAAAAGLPFRREHSGQMAKRFGVDLHRSSQGQHDEADQRIEDAPGQGAPYRAALSKVSPLVIAVASSTMA